jgi:peptide/nickel transport system permease protein
MRFALRSLLQFVLVIFAVTFVAFGALNYLGDPLFNILGPIALEESGPEFAEVRAEARAQFHLDDPFPVRYGRWVGDMLTGDFGRSYSNQVSVRSILADKIPVTAFLMVYAQIIAVVVSVPWALWTASRAYRLGDKVSTVVSFTMLGIPVFALTVLLFWLFAIKWQIFPTRYEDDTIGQRLASLFLPAVALAIPLIATYQRLLRTDLISTLQEDFISVARAKGLPKWFILFRHALRPSLFSLLTVFGIQVASLIGGSLVVERQFQIPGIGFEVVEAIFRDDFPVVLAVVVVVSVAFVAVNVLVDLIYSFLDPRVDFNG